MAGKYLTENPALALDHIVTELKADKVLVVTDMNVVKFVFPLLGDSKVISGSPRIELASGEDAKNLENVANIWGKLEEIGATRSSVIVNIGGGVITDMGGFAAATFKRGIKTVNLPTTLLGAVDAATGGKTGINFNGLKNEIGAFHMPSKVIVTPLPFATLNHEEILSGYAEMVKTAIISDMEFYKELLDLDSVISDEMKLGVAVEKCVSIKDEIVSLDPTEKGLRKILNFGHTVGHAFESLRIEDGNPVSHGKAVAHGMMVALFLSRLELGLDQEETERYSRFLIKHFGGPLVEKNRTEEIIKKMNSDKKNKSHGKPAFTLLDGIGEPKVDCIPSSNNLNDALELYFSLKARKETINN